MRRSGLRNATHARTLHLPRLIARQSWLLQRSIFSIWHGTIPQEHLPAPGHRSKSSTSCAAAPSADDFFSARSSRTTFKRASSSSLDSHLSTASSRISKRVADPPELVFARDWSRLRFLTSSGFGEKNAAAVVSLGPIESLARLEDIHDFDTDRARLCWVDVPGTADYPIGQLLLLQVGQDLLDVRASRR